MNERITCAGNPVHDRRTLRFIKRKVHEIVKVRSINSARVETSIEKYEMKRELTDYN